ncbi:hypothetical protein [Candidatus Phytoplasma melaleucae]|uniref:Uncharacterized protein n=1 Tax=Candidatus Phytoplasma melaleucae TaxID=2982630 RepID=A0ABT9DFH2_9MOLU|nr:hypothetical protein ['Melaleuca sp.' phytoplasma]MDO8168221.1 hypothetical protein ['Melaleuca sp.' phytoplasma]MDV3205498.1 hypothetical protein [Weeping tea tree witches'-broom phytoplasma]
MQTLKLNINLEIRTKQAKLNQKIAELANNKTLLTQEKTKLQVEINN